MDINFENLNSMMNLTSADIASKLESIKQTINAPETTLSSILEHIDTLKQHTLPLAGYSPLSEDRMQNTLSVNDDEVIKCGCKGPICYIIAYENTTDFNESGIYYSYDGYKWCKKVLGYTFLSLECINDIVYGVYMKEAGVTSSESILVSTDGVKWNLNTNTAYTCDHIAYIDGQYVGVSDTGMISSINGREWVTMYPSGGIPEGITSMVYHHALIAVTKYGEIDIFVDKEKWASVSPAYTEDPSKGLTKIRYLGNKFFAVGYDRIMVSEDGTHWETIMMDGLQGTDICFNGSLYVVTCNNEYLYTSTDGITWASADAKIVWTSLSSIIYARNKFVAAGKYNDTACIMKSEDGINWTRSYFAKETDIVKLEYTKNVFFILGASGNLYRLADSVTRTSKIPVPGADTTAATNICVAHNKIFATRSDDILASMDGKNWLSCILNDIPVSNVSGLTKSGDTVYIDNPKGTEFFELIDGQTIVGLYTGNEIAFTASAKCINPVDAGEYLDVQLAYHTDGSVVVYVKNIFNEYFKYFMTNTITNAIAAVSVKDSIFVIQKTDSSYILNQYRFSIVDNVAVYGGEWKDELVASIELPLFNFNGTFLPLVYSEYSDMIILPYLYNTPVGDVYGELLWAYNPMSSDVKFFKSNITTPDVKSIKACDELLLISTSSGVSIWDRMYSLTRNVASGTTILDPIEDNPFNGRLTQKCVFTMGTEKDIFGTDGTGTLVVPFTPETIIVACSLTVDNSEEKFVVVVSSNDIVIPYTTVDGDVAETTALVLGKDIAIADPDNNRIDGNNVYITLPIQLTLDIVESTINWYAYGKATLNK